jgi:uncharacterized RDD family membrane protein YckC
MKLPARTPLLVTALSAFLALTWISRAQEVAPSGDQPASAPSTQPASPPAGESKDAPAAPVAPEAAPAATSPGDEHAAPAAAEIPAPDAPLRRLDVPASVDAAVTQSPAIENGDDEKSVDDTKDSPASKGKNRRHYRHPHRDGSSGGERVEFGHNATLAAGETADAVVSIFGSSTSAGKVADAVVSVFGSSHSSGDVGSSVVSVFGGSRVTGGTVGDGVVSVFGTSYVNTTVNGDVVAVFGDIELGPDAVVSGELTCLGGSVKRDPHAVVHGQVHNVAFGPSFGGYDAEHSGFQAWITRCLFLGRPLAFDSRVLWAWWISFAFLGLYAVLALVFPVAATKCVATLNERPWYSILTSILAIIVTPVVIVLLCVTVVGIVVVPFLGAGLFFATLFGKAVMLLWLGRSITKHLGEGQPLNAGMATLAGGGIVLLLYTVPILGFVVYKALGVLGLGVVIYTLILGTKRKPVAATPQFIPPVVPAAAATSAGFGTTGSTGSVQITPMITSSDPSPVPPVLVSAATLDRAGFWIRIAASLLDAVIVGITINLIPRPFQPNFMFALAAYCVVLWALKGTTIGGIVCNLRVVRTDDRPMDWPTSLVRALGGFLSFFVAGIGFIWVAFDDQKQSWHDKIAGTTVVVVPKGVPLV